MSKEKNLRKFMDRFFDGGIYLLPPFVREVEGTDADGMSYAGMAINPQDIETAIQKLLATQREEVLSEAIKIFEPFRNVPMTGNVVILELQVMKDRSK